MRRKDDPVGNFRFALDLGFIRAAGFSECSGLQLETRVFEYREGGRNSQALKFPDGGSIGVVTLKRGVTSGANSDALFKWQHDVMAGAFDKVPKRETMVVAIELLDEMARPVKRWNLSRAFPVKWIGPELKATASEVAIEVLELACEGIELQENL